MCRRAHSCPRSSLQPTHTEGTFQVQSSAKSYSGKEVAEVDAFAGGEARMSRPARFAVNTIHTYVKRRAAANLAKPRQWVLD